VSHTPKTAALIAHAEGLLSDAGEARLARHLGSCAVCREELARIRAYEKVAVEARAALPEIDFAKMDAALERESARISREIRQKAKRPPYGLYAMAVAAIVLLGLLIAWPDSRPPETSRREPEPEPTVTAPPIVFLEPTVTLAAGGATKAPRVALHAGDVLHEGDRLETAADGVLHVILTGETGVVVEPDTIVTLAQAREEGVKLALASGRVSSVVEPFQRSSTFVVLAGGHSIEARGTRFVVSYLDGVVGVDLSQGAVLVRTPDAREIELDAPARWSSSGIAADTGDEPAQAATPRPLGSVAVQLSAPDVMRWELDGTTVDTTGVVQLRVAPGEHRVRAWHRDDRVFNGLVRAGSEPVFLSEGELTAEAPRLRQGHLEEADIQRVMQEGRRQIARCHERAMRLRPDQRPPPMRLRIHVGLLGEVSRVQLLGAGDAAPELRECIVRYAESWTFPPPGGSVPPIELPLTFSARM
jgi:hypothetical protein